MIKIITIPHPLLRQKSQPVLKIDKKLLDFIKILKETLMTAENPPGVGLSGVQIGKLWRIFAARANLKSEPKIFLNPEIIWQSKELIEGVPNREDKLEGCLSVPGYYGLVKRHQKIKLKNYTLDANNYKLTEKTSVFSGFLATVIQHEIDHLNGILFIDRVLAQKSKLYKQENKELVEVNL